MTRARCIVLAALLLAGAAGPAAAEESNRIFGFGTGLGIGRAGSSRPDTANGYNIIFFPSLSLHLPVSDTVEVELWVPISNSVLSLFYTPTTFVWADLFVNWHPFERVKGLVVAPGIGFQYVAMDDLKRGMAIEIPVRLGYEVSSRSGLIGALFAVRPWVDRLIPLNGQRSAWEYGIAVEATFQLYVTKQR